MGQPNGESDVSLGSIAERAEKLEAPKPEEKAPESTPKEGETPEAKGETPAPEDKKPDVTPEAVKKTEPLPNDPNELRKWNTKVSMELSEMKKMHAESQKQIQQLADMLSKSTKKQVDWKELAKDPAKLQAAVDELNAQTVKEWQGKYDEANYTAKSTITKKENARRFHDPNYPRWQELNPIVVKMAANADRRIDFDKEPDVVLDALYEQAIQDVAKDPNYKPPVAPAAQRTDLKYSEVELQAKIQEAVKKATEDAAKGLKAEENGAGVGSSGKGAPKGQGGVDKKALWNMPMDKLKEAIQQASPQ